MDVNEAISICSAFPTLKYVSIRASNVETIESIVNVLPAQIMISLSSVTKSMMEELDPEISRRIKSLSVSITDRYSETIDIGFIISKFPNSIRIGYPFLLDQNVSNLGDITALLYKTAAVDVSPKVMEAYKEYCVNQGIENMFAFGSQRIYDRTSLNFNNRLDEYYYPASDFKYSTDYSEYAKISQTKTLILMASSMVDVPLEVAERLKQYGVKCKIRIESYDNSSYQNTDYTLDEYLAISRNMDMLIGDIDVSLPETERFSLIYQRILNNIQYDYAAVSPIGRVQRKYAEKNEDDCRNLKNALLHGKAVCAGLADALKNACILKNLEGEYIEGPVDFLENKNSYFKNKKSLRDKVVFSDDKSVITRVYHAWNKIKINGVWYNFDPTWDQLEIANGKAPKYAFLSDEVLRKLGRPTSEVLRHQCKRDIFGIERNNMFPGLEPSESLVTNNKIMEFESTVDEQGNPREFPVISKVFPWTRIMTKLKDFAKKQQANVSEFINHIKSTKNSEKGNMDTRVNLESLVVSIKSKASWELSDDELNKVKEAENNQKIEDEAHRDDTKEDERGD